VAHSHSNDKPLGLSDVIAGAVIFVCLWYVASDVAGPQGIGFLKNLLTEQRSFELLCSGFLFLGLWLVLGKLVIVPYLEAFYEREGMTIGAQGSSGDLRKEIVTLRSELDRELHLARMEGVKRKNDRIFEAKKKAEDILLAEKSVVDAEISKMKADLDMQREQVMASLDKEVDSLSGSFYQRLTSVGSQTIH
jgi:F0F1-type ATP synthase membrane subunit b/b'